ncbi:transporter [Sandaracinobacter sp. RS1-74]|uniref:transporter n=1 Tax=Sandaracinobacteroides sayramensis TaxID=2913411 RepID=UPI001EDA6F60|nr:transporter [Sandaracinobacteroides sayramensis]MCG2841608.1 transporter [Sandaracinobacteroides sayramensis]
MRFGKRAMGAAALLGFATLPQSADADTADLAKELANPIGSLISLPFQLNYDANIGPNRDGERLVLNIQPVVPMQAGSDLTLISRTILPVIWAWDPAPGVDSRFGLGDMLQSFFFSPNSSGGLIWGAGPALTIPTGTDRLLSGRKWLAGPTAVALSQTGGWTMGALANHLWSFAGSADARERSETFVQPFLSYATAGGTTYALSADFTHDWKLGTTVMPINANVSQLTAFGRQPVSIGGGLRWHAVTTQSAPHGLGGRLTLTFLFPGQ